ncbi:RNA polymerase sigma factor [Porticoccus sp. W117]|uniref:RNA polymerase sigma factor n=1 Tax=Porticoccus sp. W117 TaxID=3054777 RepID=UPI00259A4D66|nr:RNA polymerase sigma factor [Porticoccus sp. W117]MDM3870738.1 RNA polymerase sigma factor [Porticoccus sp. W117]
MSDKNKITKEFLEYRQVIARFLRKLTSMGTPEVEDILQETFLRTYQSALKREIRFPKAFMVKTALRLANKQKQQNMRLQTEAEIEDFPESELCFLNGGSVAEHNPEKHSISLEQFQLLCRAINGLPPRCRKAFILRKIYGYSQKEIASYMGLSESTVEKHIAKGLRYSVNYMDSQLSTGMTPSGEAQKRTADTGEVRKTSGKKS